MTELGSTTPIHLNRRTVGSWALFDFANSVYPAVMTTAVFPVFYITHVVGGEGGEGELWWGWAVALSALLVAFSTPFLGALADRAGARKRFFVSYVALCLAGVAAMSTLEAGMVVRGFLLFVVANVGFESALVFYNSYLPSIAPPEKQGRVSGLGFGVGYVGSALGLMMALPFVDTIWIVWLLVAGFFLLFSLPAFFFLPADKGRRNDAPASTEPGAQQSLAAIVVEVWRLKNLRNFLVSYFFYIDGVLTIIAMAGVVAIVTFGFSQEGVIVLFLIVQFSALIGAFALAKPTDKAGPKKVLGGVLSLWIAAGVAAYFIQGQAAFYVLAIIAGLGLGSVQSASRAAMASLIPKGKEAEMFGFYALCGKSSSVLGPLLFGGVTYLVGGNQRPGFLVLTALFVVGLLLLQRVRDPKAPATPSYR